MIVDDDAAIRDALQFVLQLEGVEVRGHADGPALLANQDLSRAGCLILKDCMPAMDGCELLKRVHEQNLSPPAILLAGAVTPALRARAEEAGIWRILEKPILDGRLVDAVSYALSQYVPPILKH
jgi:FixJ family two-component response regulator